MTCNWSCCDGNYWTTCQFSTTFYYNLTYTTTICHALLSGLDCFGCSSFILNLECHCYVFFWWTCCCLVYQPYYWATLPSRMSPFPVSAILSLCSTASQLCLHLTIVCWPELQSLYFTFLIGVELDSSSTIWYHSTSQAFFWPPGPVSCCFRWKVNQKAAFKNWINQS